MKIADVRANAFAMPLNDPAYPRGPYKFYNREFVVITYRTDPERAARRGARAAGGDRRHGAYEFIRMPDSHRLRRLYRDRPGDSGALHRQGRRGAGRRLRPRHVSRRQLADRRRPRDLGLPQEARHARRSATRTRRWSARCITARCSASTRTMGYKHREIDPAPILKSLARPNFMIKIIPHVDCTPRICELVRYYMRGCDPEGRLVAARRRCSCSTMRCATWPGCRCARWCRPPTTSPT